jgi:lipid-binding SYLF domain-containing protein
MKMLRSVVIAATTMLLFCNSLSAVMAKEVPRNIDNVLRVLKETTASKKDRIPPELLKNALGIAIFPGANKSDFMVSGRSAGGVLLVHDTAGNWSNPVFITMSGGALGWQSVGEPMDIVLIFKNMKRIDALVKGKLFMDVKVKLVPGPVGKIAKAAAKEEQKAEIDFYVRSHGAFAEATVASSTVQIDNAANEAFYGKPQVSAGDILSGKAEKTSDDIKGLQKFLVDNAASK